MTIIKVKSVNRILNCLPSNEQHDDWNSNSAFSADSTSRGGTIPASVDLRASWWGVGDQGSTGSCVGWAVGDSALRYHFVKTNKISQTDHISPRFIWLASKEDDEYLEQPTTFIESAGTFIKDALKIVSHYGSVLENVLPFNGSLYQGNQDTFYATAAKLKITSFHNLGINLNDWRDWIANYGVIVVRIDIDNTWLNVGTNGKLNTLSPINDGNNHGHAVSLVGYTPEYFIVRNSWGTTFGDKGFAYASNNYAQSIITEAYGIRVT
jgi:C1A family cysteine protease